MEITTEMIKTLRESTGAGILDCRKALEQSNGDLKAALEFLRENGIREIFEVQCSECHLSTPSGGFSITSYTRVLQGSNLGPIIIPGIQMNRIFFTN